MSYWPGIGSGSTVYFSAGEPSEPVLGRMARWDHLQTPDLA